MFHWYTLVVTGSREIKTGFKRDLFDEDRTCEKSFGRVFLTHDRMTHNGDGPYAEGHDILC